MSFVVALFVSFVQFVSFVVALFVSFVQFVSFVVALFVSFVVAITLILLMYAERRRFLNMLDDPNPCILDHAGQWIVEGEALRRERTRFDTLIHFSGKHHQGELRPK